MTPRIASPKVVFFSSQNESSSRPLLLEFNAVLVLLIIEFSVLTARSRLEEGNQNCDGIGASDPRLANGEVSDLRPVGCKQL